MAAVMTSLGTVLVLESDNNRIQALDVFGNPVQLFKNQTSPYFLNLDETNGSIYLDIAVEYSGFIYVLSSDQGQTMYRLDIYHPSQTGTAPISKTMSFNAGRIVVDYWRNVYALNYEVLALPNGHLPQTGITEPSVSLWIPENSSSDAALSPPAPWSAPSPSAFRAPRPLRRRQLLSSLISPWRIA